MGRLAIFSLSLLLTISCAHQATTEDEMVASADSASGQKLDGLLEHSSQLNTESEQQATQTQESVADASAEVSDAVAEGPNSDIEVVSIGEMEPQTSEVGSEVPLTAGLVAANTAKKPSKGSGVKQSEDRRPAQIDTPSTSTTNVAPVALPPAVIEDDDAPALMEPPEEPAQGSLAAKDSQLASADVGRAFLSQGFIILVGVSGIVLIGYIVWRRRRSRGST